MNNQNEIAMGDLWDMQASVIKDLEETIKAKDAVIDLLKSDLQDQDETWKSTDKELKKCLEYIKELEANDKILREALEFYAGKNELNVNGKIRRAWSEDSFEFIFERARKALAEVDKKERKDEESKYPLIHTSDAKKIFIAGRLCFEDQFMKQKKAIMRAEMKARKTQSRCDKIAKGG